MPTKKAKPAKKSAPAKKSVVAKKKPTPTKKPAPVKKVQKIENKSAAKSEPKKEREAENERPLMLLRGMKDVLPKEDAEWRKVFRLVDEITEAYGYQYMSTPVVEDANLFIRSVGRGTDVVEKEMYLFEDKDGRKVCLRPELTASVVRAYIDHGLHTVPQPVKVWYIGPMFRHDRPQAGRYRQFNQFDCEVLGERDPVIDAELVAVGFNFLKELGVPVQVEINSIGTKEDRERYIAELTGYLKTRRADLSEDSKKRLLKNPLRVLDSKDEGDMAVVANAPQILDWLSDNSKKYFMSVLEYLDELSIPYLLKPTLVRGLDYYSDTVFEYVADGMPEFANMSFGGGGRYDALVEELGGRPTPAAGFAIGVERALLARRAVLNSKRKDNGNGEVGTETVEAMPEEVESKEKKIFFAHLGEQSRRRTLRHIETLRVAGIKVGHALSKSSLKNQLELANKQGAVYTLILGQRELQDGTVIVRDMVSGTQEIIREEKLVEEVRRILGRVA